MQCIHTQLHRAGDGESLVSGSRRRSWWNCAPGHGPAPASALGWSAGLGRVRAPSGAMEPPSGGEWEQVEDRTPLHTAHTELAPARPARPLTHFISQIKPFISLAESLRDEVKPLGVINNQSYLLTDLPELRGGGRSWGLVNRRLNERGQVFEGPSLGPGWVRLEAMEEDTHTSPKYKVWTCGLCGT